MRIIIEIFLLHCSIFLSFLSLFFFNIYNETKILFFLKLRNLSPWHFWFARYFVWISNGKFLSWGRKRYSKGRTEGNLLLARQNKGVLITFKVTKQRTLITFIRRRQQQGWNFYFLTLSSSRVYMHIPFVFFIYLFFLA